MFFSKKTSSCSLQIYGYMFSAHYTIIRVLLQQIPSEFQEKLQYPAKKPPDFPAGSLLFNLICCILPGRLFFPLIRKLHQNFHCMMGRSACNRYTKPFKFKGISTVGTLSSCSDTQPFTVTESNASSSTERCKIRKDLLS